MKYKYVSLFLMVMVPACDFNVTNSPGPQISSSIEIAKKNGTFICAYKAAKQDSIIGRLQTGAVFLERRYRREKDFFLTKEINCCASQLVVISSQPLMDYGTRWKLKDFTRQPSSFCVIKESAGVNAPDSIQLHYIEFNEMNKDTLFKVIDLYKVNN